MIIDTSAMVAILYREPEAEAFARLIRDADACRISVANHVGLSMVIENQLGPEGMRQAEAFFRRAGITVRAGDGRARRTCPTGLPRFRERAAQSRPEL